MPGYVSVDGVCRNLLAYADRMCAQRKIEYANGVTSAKARIENYPRADVAEIVRCKDCKHYRFDPSEQEMACVEDADEVDGFFSGFLRYTGPEWFCADGERKDDGKTDN